MKKGIDLIKEIDEMKNRLLLKANKKAVKEKIKVYSEGVKGKIRNAEYALSRIKELAQYTPDYLSSTNPDTFQAREKIHLYVDSFFAFLFSSFDVISQVINQIENISDKEDKINFYNLKTHLDNKSHGLPLQCIYNNISEKKYFKELRDYRNCSTHRRQIYIETQTLNKSGTPGYNLSGAHNPTVTGSHQAVKWYLCDNPSRLRPTINKYRELEEYCSRMLENCRKYIIKIANEVR